MKRIYILSAIACFAVLTTRAQKKQAKKIDTLFFEDFNEQALDRTKWNVEVTGNTVNDEQQAYVDSTSTIYLLPNAASEGAKNGALVLQAIYHPGYVSKENKKYDFLSGRINTKDKWEFTYGSASARIKMAGGAGLWPAFWLLGNGEWPNCGEIDIMETVGDSTWTSNAMHGPGYFGNTPLTKRNTFPAGVDVTQWHVYTADWTPDAIVFKIDDKVTYTVTKAMVKKYGRWAFDNKKFVILNFALGGGYPNGVNKIKTPYYGISQSSVDKIKAGQAKTVIDWVLVTKAK